MGFMQDGSAVVSFLPVFSLKSLKLAPKNAELDDMRKFGKTFLSQSIAVALFAVAAFPVTLAQPRPLDFFRNIGNTNRTVDTDPNKEYRLTETEGPYLILATALSGPTAQQDAHAIVLELRNKYRWNAYVFEKNFAHNAQQDFGRTQNRTNIRYNREGETQFAVLIGNFPSMEDNQFRRTLEEVRRCEPEALTGRRSVAAFSFPMAFGLANPMLPPEHLQGTVDPFIESINRDSPYSLLRNPRRYTVQIATFTGRAVIDPKEIRNIEEGRSSFDRELSALEISGQAAAKLCKFLRDRGVEAYEFHDRHNSIVTVGSFDSTGRQLPDGTLIPDPHVQQVIQQFQGQVVDGIQCSPQPRLIAVPRVVRR